MFTDQYITDLRLKAYLAGLKGNQVALRRTQAKVLKGLKKTVAVVPKPGSNTIPFDRDKALVAQNRVYSATQREHDQLRKEARAAHLYRMMLRGRPYKKVEQGIKDTTLAVDCVILSYFPGIFGSPDYNLQAKVNAWVSAA